MVLDYKTLLAY